jgi:hypothetical protein
MRRLRIDLANRNKSGFNQVTTGICLLGLELLQHDAGLALDVSAREVLRCLGADLADADARAVEDLRYHCMMVAQEFLIKGMVKGYAAALDEHAQSAAELAALESVK